MGSYTPKAPHGVELGGHGVYGDGADGFALDCGMALGWKSEDCLSSWMLEKDEVTEKAIS